MRPMPKWKSFDCPTCESKAGAACGDTRFRGVEFRQVSTHINRKRMAERPPTLADVNRAHVVYGLRVAEIYPSFENAYAVGGDGQRYLITPETAGANPFSDIRVGQDVISAQATPRHWLMTAVLAQSGEWR